MMKVFDFGPWCKVDKPIPFNINTNIQRSNSEVILIKL